jgi:predicted KAP-like P-loop ATPase
MILTDNETKVDLLNNEAIAKTIIELLREKPERAVTIGVHGDWGAGKSSILEMIENGLSSDEEVLCIKFNGWRFQGFEDAKIALIEGIVTGLIEKRPLLTQAGLAVKDIFKRIDWLKIARHGGGLAFTAFTGKDSAILTEWKAADAIRAWARLSPPLAEVDLRPYLFVTKDRKDYFGAASVLGRLAAVVEKLLGPKLAVQAFEGELKQLVPAEAAQVFEELRGRVMGGDAFDTAPSGIDGLAVLVRAHPTLQANLLDLLEAVPADRCGPWPASGWEGVIKDSDALTRFEKLLQGWSTSGSTFLKTTASAALRTRKGGR